MSARLDFTIEKRARFYREIDLQDLYGNPVSLIGLNVACTIKESYSTVTTLFVLTQANGGVLVVDALNGKVGLWIPSNQTDIVQNNGVYDIQIQDPLYPTLDSTRLLQGNIVFSYGVT